MPASVWLRARWDRKERSRAPAAEVRCGAEADASGASEASLEPDRRLRFRARQRGGPVVVSPRAMRSARLSPAEMQPRRERLAAQLAAVPAEAPSAAQLVVTLPREQPPAGARREAAVRGTRARSAAVVVIPKRWQRRGAATKPRLARQLAAAAPLRHPARKLAARRSLGRLAVVLLAELPAGPRAELPTPRAGPQVAGPKWPARTERSARQ